MGISLTGLVSGLDTAQMVSDLMSIERIPYDNLETKKSNLQTEQSIFRSVNTAFRSLETSINNLRYSGDWKTLTGTISNASVLSTSVSDTATAGKYQINVQQLAQKNTVQIKGDHVLGKLTNENSININGINIDISSLNSSNQDKLTGLKDLINQKSSETGVSASIVNTSATGNEYRLILTANDTGDANKISFNVGSDDLATQIVRPTDPSSVDPNTDYDVIFNNATNGTLNAIFTIDGVRVERSSNQIEKDDLLTGVAFNLTDTGNATITVARDTAAITKSVEEFVKQYNNLIKLVKDNLSKPTTEDTVNPLQGDSLLKQIENELYGLFTTGVSKDPSNINSPRFYMEDFGLSIDKGAVGASMTGKITFDSSKFQAALINNPDDVITTFTAFKKDSTKTTDQGVMTRLGGIINKYASSYNGLITNKVTGYDSEIKVVDQSMERMSLRLEKYEARLKQQFSTMETLLSSLKSEQQWLTSQFEALTKSSS